MPANLPPFLRCVQIFGFHLAYLDRVTILRSTPTPLLGPHSISFRSLSTSNEREDSQLPLR